jgi:hypothetical protein
LCIRESYQQLRGLSLLLIGCHIIVLKALATTEDKIYDMEESFYEILEHVFDKFPKQHMQILLRDFIAKVSRQDFLNRQFGMQICTKLVTIMELW